MASAAALPPLVEMKAPLALDTDAAMVLGMASTAMPFARSVDAETERWLRILRLHGDVGRVLQALGLGEAPLEALSRYAGSKRPDAAKPDNRDVIATVTENAVRVAGQRGVQEIGTSDVFVAVMQVYGADFDRVLWAHGTDCDEVLERLGVTIPGVTPRLREEPSARPRPDRTAVSLDE
jgi:hypothetical protein